MFGNKFLLVFILFFVCGVSMGCVCASHTYHVNGYTFKVSDEKYNNIQRVKKYNDFSNVNFKVKTNKFKTVEVPKYKEKKVTKYKWKYAYVKKWKNNLVWGGYKEYKIPSKYKSWKYIGDDVGYSSNGEYAYGYHVFKKKVPVDKVVKKVKVGTKKVKLRVYACGGMSRVPMVQFRAMGNGYNYPTDFMRYRL